MSHDSENIDSIFSTKIMALLELSNRRTEDRDALFSYKKATLSIKLSQSLRNESGFSLLMFLALQSSKQSCRVLDSNNISKLHYSSTLTQGDHLSVSHGLFHDLHYFIEMGAGSVIGF